MLLQVMGISMCIRVRVFLRFQFVLLLIPFSIACAPIRVESDKLVTPPDSWHLRHATDGSDCLNLTGEYEMWGEPAPQWPSTLDGIPFSLDVLLPIDIPYEDELKVDGVKVEQQNGSGITLVFMIGERPLLFKRIPIPGGKVVCDRDRVIVTTLCETAGEAMRKVKAVSIDTMFIGQDGSLIVNSVIQETGWVFMPPRYRAEYWVRFKAKSK